ncbi:MAG: hypothetical protein U0263_33235 [Polyangiaceae bacterium]
MSRRHTHALAAVLALLACAASARAAGPLGPEGAPIGTSDYRVDLTTGVVLAGTRVLGLAGAYVAIAEGVDGNAVNPVAPAVRPIHSVDHFDYDLGFGLTFPAAVSGNDLFNSGDRTAVSSTQSSALFIDLAANFALGRWGAGASLHYDVRGGSSGASARARRALRWRAAAGRALVASSSSARAARARVSWWRTRSPKRASPKSSSTSKAQRSARLARAAERRPVSHRCRRALLPVVTTDLSADVPRDSNGDRVISRNGVDLYLPNQVALPWDIDVGAAINSARAR